MRPKERRRKRNERIARGIYWDDDYIFEPLPPKFDTVRTGQLGLRIFGWGDRMRRSWNDGKTQALETLFDEFVDSLEAHIATERVRREERERAEAEHRELERRRGLAKSDASVRMSGICLLEQANTNETTCGAVEGLACHLMNMRSTPDRDAALSRMIEWARARLVTLEASIEPAKLVEELERDEPFSRNR